MIKQVVGSVGLALIFSSCGLSQVPKDLAANDAYIDMEAEEAALSGSMVTSANANASGGNAIASSTDNSGVALFGLEVPVAGKYVIWARVLSADSAADSFFVSIDGAHQDIFDGDVVSSSFHYTKVGGRILGSPRIFDLKAGSHILSFAGREAGMALDKIIVTNDLKFNPADKGAKPVLSVSKTGMGSIVGGGINCGIVCSIALKKGSQVTLTATPAAGNVFGSWSGACSGVGTCTVTLNSDASVNATFVPTGSGSIHTAASANLSDVRTAVAAAARGDTVLVPAGNVGWDSALVLTRGIKLMGAGRNSTFISGGHILISISPDAQAIANDEVIRVEGFTLDGNNTALKLLTVSGANELSLKPFRNLAVGNNRFRNTSTITSEAGAVSTDGQLRGTIFNNIFDRVNVVLKVMGNDEITEWSSGRFPANFGSADNLYFEDNTVQYSSAFFGQDPGWTETGQGGRLVMRYNTWDQSNVSHFELWDTHGFQNFPGNGQTGTMITEYYGNKIINGKGGRWMTHRGGQGLIFNNVDTGPGGMAIELNQYAAGDASGSGCTEDVPGASGVFSTIVQNTYTFGNLVNGLTRNMGEGPIGNGCGTSENNNYWNLNPLFNGASGIGRGTSAPQMNCTKGTAFWVNANPGTTTDPSVIQNGVLYKCVATNTWVNYYRPFTYPHPLRQ